MASGYHVVLAISVKGHLCVMSKSCQFREICRNIRRKKNNGKKETAKKKSTKVEKTLESSQEN